MTDFAATQAQLAATLSEQYFTAFVVMEQLCTYSTCVGFECLCILMRVCICTFFVYRAVRAVLHY